MKNADFFCNLVVEQTSKRTSLPQAPLTKGPEKVSTEDAGDPEEYCLVIRVLVQKASFVPATDLGGFGKSDPYVQARLVALDENHHHHTAVGRKDNTTPSSRNQSNNPAFARKKRWSREDLECKQDPGPQFGQKCCFLANSAAKILLAKCG